MSNQICPWDFDSESQIYQGLQNGVQQKNKECLQTKDKQNCAKKRPLTSKTVRTQNKQKKIVRPSSCKRSIIENNSNNFLNQQRPVFSYSLSTSCRSNESSQKKISNKNIEANLKKRQEFNPPVLYSGYQNFSKNKIRRPQRNSIVFRKNELWNKQQKNLVVRTKKQTQILLNSKLLSALRLSKAQNQALRISLHAFHSQQLNPSKPIQTKPVSRKNGFVYYNQSFLQANQLRFA